MPLELFYCNRCGVLLAKVPDKCPACGYDGEEFIESFWVESDTVGPLIEDEKEDQEPK